MAGRWRPTDVRPFLSAGPVLLAVAACGLIGDPIQDEWESRDKYPSCGEVQLDQGDRLAVRGRQEIDCLRKALDAGQGAEMSVSSLTIEGDPIREYYRLTPAGVLEVYVDSTDDQFSDQKWSMDDCHTPKWLPEVSCE